MLIINKMMILISIVLLLLCVLTCIRKNIEFQKNSFVQKILRPHAFYGTLLLITSLVHGILSGKKPGMMTGKLAWLCLLILLSLSVLKRKVKKEKWIRIHRVCTVCLCVTIAVHILHAIIW